MFCIVSQRFPLELTWHIRAVKCIFLLASFSFHTFLLVFMQTPNKLHVLKSISHGLLLRKPKRKIKSSNFLLPRKYIHMYMYWVFAMLEFIFTISFCLFYVLYVYNFLYNLEYIQGRHALFQNLLLSLFHSTQRKEKEAWS